MTSPEPSIVIRKWLLICLLAMLVFTSLSSRSDGVTMFGMYTEVKEPPAPIQFEDIWFYDRDMNKVLPAINYQWITVVLRTVGVPESSGTSDRAVKETLLWDTAKAVASGYAEVADTFYDHNLAEDACFFRLQDGVEEGKARELIAELNAHEAVSYAQPTISIKDKVYAFFNAFTLEWKTDVDSAVKERIMNQAEVFFDSDDSVYRVNVFREPFFKPLNLLAEDIHVLRVNPYLVELKPSLSAVLTLSIAGSTIGDTVPFSLVISFLPFITIDPSSLANINLKPSELQQDLFEVKFEPYDYTEAASKSPIHISGWMKFYTPGEFMIPPVTIKYTCSTCSGDQVRSIATEAVAVKISSLVPSQQTENRLIIPEDPLKPSDNAELYDKQGRFYLLVSLTFFLMVIVCIVWFVLTLRALRREGEHAPEESKDELLAQRVRGLLDGKPASPHWVQVAEVGKILREYVVAKYHVTSYPEGGSGKVFIATIKNQLPDSLVPVLQDLYETIDNVAAREVHPYGEWERFRSQALGILTG